MGKCLLSTLLLLCCASPGSSFETAGIYATTAAEAQGESLSIPTAPDASSKPQDPAAPWQPRISVLLGWRNLGDDETWEKIDNQFATGFEFDLKHRDFPVGMEIGLAGSFGYDDDPIVGVDDLWGGVYEFYLGPRLTLLKGRFHPYAAAGITFLGVDQEADVGSFNVRDDDSSVAGYVHGGAYFALNPQIDIGADVRYVYGSDIDLFGFDGDADYFQVSLLMGIRF